MTVGRERVLWDFWPSEMTLEGGESVVKVEVGRGDSTAGMVDTGPSVAFEETAVAEGGEVAIEMREPVPPFEIVTPEEKLRAVALSGAPE